MKAFRADRPEAGPDELERLVVEHQTHVATTEGAFVGGPFIVLIPVAFCASLLAQAQMVYELAAVTGRDPTDRARAAELLVLLGAYRSPADALAALDAVDGRRLPRGTRVATVRRMAYLLQLLTPPDEHRSRLRSTVGWLGIGLLFLVGLVLPLVWVPYMAYSTRRSARRMAVRAHAFYSANGSSPLRDERHLAAGAVALARMVLLIACPVLVALFGIAIGYHWLTALILLLGASALATFVWLAYRRRASSSIRSSRS